MKVEIFMPLYIGDYDRDTADLSFEEHGFYMAILRSLWTRDGVLQAADKQKLSRILRTDEATIARLWPSVARFFVIAEDGSFYQKRLLAELEKARKNRAMASERARKGGFGKAAVSASSSASSTAPSSPQAMLQVCSSPSPSPSERRRDPEAPAGIPPDDPTRPRTGYGILSLFRRIWTDAKQKPCVGERTDHRRASDFVDGIATLSEPARSETFDAIPTTIAAFLRESGFIATRGHPFDLFIKDFDRLRTATAKPHGSKPARTAIEITAEKWAGR